MIAKKVLLAGATGYLGRDMVAPQYGIHSLASFYKEVNKGV
jgi:hypothetical protein